MNMSALKNNRKFVALLFSPVLGLVLPLAVHSLVRSGGLSDGEKEMAAFSPSSARLSLPQCRTAQGLICPVKPGKAASPSAAPAAFPPIPLAEVAPPAGRPAPVKKTTDLSLILVGDAGRVAIIDGRVLKAGDRHGRHTVAAIENNRVLLKNGKEQIWLKIK
jgi:hypothetical protein